LRKAAYSRAGETFVAPVTLFLDEGEQAAFNANGQRAACTLALMAAGLVRASTGSVYVGAFDPRIQPVQVKRLAGYVPHEAVSLNFDSFKEFARYRAALWGVALPDALQRSEELREHLEGVHEAFAYPIIGALLARPRLLVLDRPQAVYASRILRCARETAIFSTHASEGETIAFRKALLAA
jgi:hypothetical protein